MELSEKAKAARADYYRKWRARNPEKVKKSWEKFWEKKSGQMEIEEKKETEK